MKKIYTSSFLIIKTLWEADRQKSNLSLVSWHFKEDSYFMLVYQELRNIAFDRCVMFHFSPLLTPLGSFLFYQSIFVGHFGHFSLLN